MRLDFTNEADLKKITKRIKFSFFKFKGLGDPDDCVQEILARMLDGKHQHSTIDQCVIDYLRVVGGDKRMVSGAAKQSFARPNSFEQGNYDRTSGVNPGRDMESRLDFIRLIEMSKHWERAIMTLFFREGYGQAEIGDFFGVSSSRVSQWLERIQKRIHSRIKAQENARANRERPGGLEKVLRQETEGISGRVEQKSPYGLAESKSWSMESFNETSF